MIRILGTAICGFGIPAVVCAQGPLIQDNVILRETLSIPGGRFEVPDADADGAVHIQGNGLVVDFGAAELVGAAESQPCQTFGGTGIVVEGRDITIRNVKVRGYKTGVHARNCDRLVIEDVDVSGNFRQKLASTPTQEDGNDWLWVHRNAGGEWLTLYGAGLCVEDSRRVTLRRITAQHGQNGIMLIRVNDSSVVDCNCSFLSGWGLALWQCSRNLISRNALDYCVRGYSEGRYARGQNSAGILLAEQCTQNEILENSATHCGSGLLAYPGPETLARTDRVGHNENRIIGNDFSFCAAYGLEAAFGFDNWIARNRIADNGIAGVWLAYCHDTRVIGNSIERNGRVRRGQSWGGIALEHGCDNRICGNEIRDNKCGVSIWTDDDAHFATTAWAQAHDRGAAKNVICDNRFEGNDMPVRLRYAADTIVANPRGSGRDIEVDADAASEVSRDASSCMSEALAPANPIGDSRPVGAHPELAGRHRILLTEYGPYDFAGTTVHPSIVSGGQEAVVLLLAPPGPFRLEKAEGAIAANPLEGETPAALTLEAKEPGITPFTLTVDVNGEKHEVRGTLNYADWKVRHFAWQPDEDPREDVQKWHALAAAGPFVEYQTPSIDFLWADSAPAEGIPADRFGTLADTRLKVPAGRYRVWTVSDDGIRVWVDDTLVIDDWTWHVPTEHTAEVSLDAGRHAIRIEHFEIDGYAQLQFRLEPVP